MRHHIFHRASRVASVGVLSFALTSGLALGNGNNPENQNGQTVAARPQEPATSDAQALERVTYDIKYMSSDEMGGRKPGTPGIQMCQDYLVDQYKKAGLKPLDNGTYLQGLEVGNTRTVLEDKTLLTLHGPNDAEIKLELGKDFQQLLGRRDFDLNTDLVFVGYGIKADIHNYNDYQDQDVEGKIVVMFRSEPQSDDVNSVFDGEQNSRFANERQKITTARRAKAAAILIVNESDAAPDDERDELMQIDRAGVSSLPIAHVKRRVIDEIIEASPLVSPLGKSLNNLAAVEKLIDKNLEPISQPISGWSAEFKSAFKSSKIPTNNVIGIVEGEGPFADETIVIGGHYDHLGMGGGVSSRAQGRIEIHNGADDNATGTAAILELARRFAKRDKKPGRRLVFICFTAEEMGLLGATHYCENPIFPLEKTAAMINFDMIGWLRKNELTIYNWNTSPQLDPIFEDANKSFGFELIKPDQSFAGSDHRPFNDRQVPNVFIHTGLNPVYHTPEDDFEAIDCEGALKVIDYSEKVIDQLASLKSTPKYGTPKPLRLGVIIDVEDETLTIDSVTSGSLAEKSGLQKGDVILEVDGVPLTKRRELTLIIRRDRGKTIKLKLKRGDAEILINVELKRDDE